MKKLLAILLVALLVSAIPLFALAEEASAPTTGWTDIVTQVVVWIIGGAFGLLAIVVKKRLVPWVSSTLIPIIKDVIVPWLEDRHLSSVAAEAVKYAEAQLGRYAGEQKWEMAKALLDKLGWDVDSTAVIAALKAAWLTLDIEQIAAGIKEAVQSKPPDDPGNPEA